MTSSVTRKNLTFRPWEQAAVPSAVARCVFPVPDGPTRRMFLPTVEILSLHEFEDLRLVDAWPCREVELVEQLRSGESRRLDPPFCRLPLPLDEFELHELRQERQVIGVVGRTPVGDLLGFGA